MVSEETSSTDSGATIGAPDDLEHAHRWRRDIEGAEVGALGERALQPAMEGKLIELDRTKLPQVIGDELRVEQ